MAQSNTVTIAGVALDNLSLQEVLAYARTFLADGFQHYIVTPNPEFIVAAHHDRQFKDILNAADIALADGNGLVKAARLSGQRVQRVTGIDAMIGLCEMAEQLGSSVFFLGAAPGVAQRTADVIQRQFPNLTIAGATDGGVVEDPLYINDTLVAQISSVAPALLFVAFGHGTQEKWIYRHLDLLPSVRIAMGVGGSFDYLAGTVHRAPGLMRKLGLEWLFRLIQQPQRWRRIVTALVEFPLLLIWLKIFQKKLR